MVKRLNGGRVAIYLPLVAQFLAAACGGMTLHAPHAMAQEVDAEEDGYNESTDSPSAYSAPRYLVPSYLTPQFSLRGSQSSGEEDTASGENPFGDSPAGSGGDPVTTLGQTDTSFGQLAGDDSSRTAGQTSNTTSQGATASSTSTTAAKSGLTEDEKQAREAAVKAEQGVLDPINTASPSSKANVAEMPVESGTRRRTQVDPFLPTGFRAGTWQVFTRLEQAAGYSSNNSFAADGEPGWFSQTDGSVRMISDWSRHEASIEATGSLRRAFDTGEGNIPTAGIKGNLRLDLVDGYTAGLGGYYNYSTEALSSTSLVSGTSSRPGIHSYGASAEAARTGGRLDLTLRGTADRTTYEQALLGSGSTVSQDDRNNTLYELTARAAYGPTPSFKPFVQGGVGRRVYDEETDRNGESRSSSIYDLRTGLQFNLHEKLTGEIAAGYRVEDFEDDSLETLRGYTLNGNIDWSPERDTNIKLTAETSFGGSTTAGDNGSVNYRLLAEAVRRVRDNLALSATASYGLTQYDTTDTADRSYKIGAGVEYWVSRHLSLTGDVEYERFDSATSGSSWNATSVRVGMAWQH